MRYLAVLGRQPEISLAELSALFSRVSQISSDLATFSSDKEPSIARLGGSLKLATELDGSPLDFLTALPEGKITIGVSDYSAHSSARKAQGEALKLKKILARHGRSVRVVENKSAVFLSQHKISGIFSVASRRNNNRISRNDRLPVTGVLMRADHDVYSGNGFGQFFIRIFCGIFIHKR